MGEWQSHPPPENFLFGRWLETRNVPRKTLPQVAMWDGERIWFGRYSIVNDIWMAWNGHEYVTIWPSHYRPLVPTRICHASKD